MSPESIEMHISSLVGQGPEGEGEKTQDMEPGFIDAENNIVEALPVEDVHDDQKEVTPGLVEQPDIDAASKALTTSMAESSGRLDQIVELRGQLREQGEAVNQMREMMLVDATERAKTAETAKFGRDVLEDPAMQRLDARFDKLEGRYEQDKQQREHRIQEVNRITEDQRKEKDNMEQLSNFAISSEQKFVASHPDVKYHEAYDHLRQVRGKFYSTRGMNKAQIEERLGMEEIQLITEAAGAGRDPATDIYNMAIEFGFDPASVPVPVVDPVIPVPLAVPTPDLSKVKAGLELANPTNLTSSPGGNTSGTLTRDQFFNQLSYPERMAILADQDKFEQLSKTGKVTL